MTRHSGDSINVSPETKAVLKDLKQEREVTWDELQRELVEEELGVSWEEIESREVEQHERIERTRATVVAVLEAVDEADMKDEILDIVRTLSQQDMLATNQDIIDHLLAKAKNNEPLNEGDELLAEIVMETEQGRAVERSPAAEIAQGLFDETDTTAAERTTTERQTTTSPASASDEAETEAAPSAATLDIASTVERTDEEI